MAETKTVLVAGATGQQGGAVTRSLVARGHRVRGLTRARERFKDVRALGAEPVAGDLTDASTLRPLLRGADGFFVVTTPFGPNFTVDVEGEVRQGTVAVDAAKAAGIAHVVLGSVASADEGTGIPHFESKARVERHLRASGVPYTITRPVAFMDLFLSPWMARSLEAGVLSQPLPGSYRQQLVAVRDIGEIAARAFERRDAAFGKAVDLAGDRVTMTDLAAKLSTRIGHPVRYVEQPEAEAVQRMGDDGLRMYRWFKSAGYHVDIPALEREWGYRMTRLDEFLATPPLPRS